MKKLMIAAAIVCAAAMSQAAQIKWSVAGNSWYMSNGTSRAPAGTAVYLINSADWSTIESALAGGKTSFTTADTGILDVGATTGTKGQVSQTTASSSQLTAGTEYAYAYLVIDGDKYFASDTLTKAAFDPNVEEYKEATSIAFNATQYSTAGLSGGWQSVPEPTSAMLLLLGVAGLALRRRRA